MEWFRKKWDSFSKNFGIFSESASAVFTLATVTLSLISFGYFISNTEYKYEDGYIIKKGYSINNITKSSCTLFKEPSTFDSFNQVTKGYMRYIAIFQFFLTQIVLLIVQGYLLVTKCRKEEEATETTEDQKKSCIKPINVLKYAFKILLQPGTFVITVVNYSKPCLQLDIPEVFLQISIFSVLGFLLAIMSISGLRLLRTRKHGCFEKLIFSKDELEEQDRSTRIFFNILIISYIVFSSVLFFVALLGSVISILNTAMNILSFTICIMNAIKSKNICCCC
jgi:hypothetical protein